MAKLSSAREGRLYGPWRVRNCWEYINAVVLLAGGILAQLSTADDAKSGFVVFLISLAIFGVVNLHDLAAHMAGDDFRSSVMWSDAQLVLVEFGAPLFHSLGFLLPVLTVALLLAQEYRGYEVQLHMHCLSLLVAGLALWVMVQFLILVKYMKQMVDMFKSSKRGRKLVWFGIWGSWLILVGGLVNLVKVFKIQQRSGVRLERLRVGAQERLRRAREGQEPLLREEPRAVRIVNEGNDKSSTTYKDVLTSES